jgi:hypothetical protein
MANNVDDQIAIPNIRTSAHPDILPGIRTSASAHPDILSDEQHQFFKGATSAAGHNEVGCFPNSQKEKPNIDIEIDFQNSKINRFHSRSVSR